MSRVSRKSELSPSITRGSSGIDLGKNSGVDMGRKSEPSITSGGIGLRQEVTNVGGMSVSGGIEVDLTPVDFGINYDASERTVSIATGAEIPGGILGVSGGIEIDLNTGEVIGGSIGGEIGGFGINLSNSEKGGLGIEFTYQIGLIELSLGFGFPPKDPDTPTPTPTPSPSPSPTPGGSDANLRTNWEQPTLPAGDPNKTCTVVIAYDIRSINWYPNGSLNAHYETHGTGTYNPSTQASSATITNVMNYPNPTFPVGIFNGTMIVGSTFISAGVILGTVRHDGRQIGDLVYIYGKEDKVYAFLNTIPINKEGTSVSGHKQVDNKIYQIIYSNCSVPDTNTPSPSPSPSTSPSPSPFPNPPPRRNNKMDECCKQNLAFLRLIYTKLGLANFPVNSLTQLFKK